MSDATHHDRDTMYCHGCHHQWQREGDSIECPACRGASTEIVRESPPPSSHGTSLTHDLQISSDDDPRHFHNQQPASAANITSASAPAAEPTPAPVYGPGRPPSTGPGSTPNNNSTNGPNRPHQPEIQFIFTPQVTFFTTIVSNQAPPAPTQQQQQQQQQSVLTEVPPANGPGAPPVTWFGMHFFTPRFHQAGPPPAPPTTGTTTGTNSPPTGSADGAATAQQQEQQQQTTTQNQPQPQPNPQQPQQHSGPVPMFPGPGPLAGGLMAALHLAALFDPTGLGIFGQPNGDAVYSQEQLDRIITYLREAQGQGGGAPPASQTAIDKLQTKEVDEEMLGTAAGDKPKCVICVDEMAKGEKVAVLPCTHIFHGECVTPWLKQHNTCPVCRRSIEELEQGKGVKQHQDEHQAEQQHEAAAPNNTTGCV